MALLFQQPIQTVDGFTVDNAYARVEVINPAQGDALMCSSNIYASKAAFEGGSNPVNTRLVTGVLRTYDYATDSKDILDLAHTALIQVYADQGINAVKEL